MALFFKKVLRTNPRDLTAPKKWYASLKSIGMRRESEIAVLAADGTTLDPKEAELAYSRFGIVVVRSLLDGHTVEIANLGSFRLTVNSEGVDTKEELTANNIENLNLRFVPYEATKDALKKATFKDLETMQLRALKQSLDFADAKSRLCCDKVKTLFFICFEIRTSIW